MKALTKIVLLGAWAAAATLMAGTLDFSTPNICSANADGSGALVACSHYAPINQAFGDTTGLNVTYLDGINNASLMWWDTGYGTDLPAVAMGGNAISANNEIIFTPAAGYSVTLGSFRLGSWMGLLATHLVISEVGGGTLIDYGVVTPDSHYPALLFTPNVTSTNGIIIHWYDTTYNIGVDNIAFTVGATGVPEPATCAIVGAGLMAVLAMTRRIRGNSTRGSHQ